MQHGRVDVAHECPRSVGRDEDEADLPVAVRGPGSEVRHQPRAEAAGAVPEHDQRPTRVGRGLTEPHGGACRSVKAISGSSRAGGGLTETVATCRSAPGLGGGGGLGGLQHRVEGQRPGIGKQGVADVVAAVDGLALLMPVLVENHQAGVPSTPYSLATASSGSAARVRSSLRTSPLPRPCVPALTATTSSEDATERLHQGISGVSRAHGPQLGLTKTRATERPGLSSWLNPTLSPVSADSDQPDDPTVPSAASRSSSLAQLENQAGQDDDRAHEQDHQHCDDDLVRRSGAQGGRQARARSVVSGEHDLEGRGAQDAVAGDGPPADRGPAQLAEAVAVGLALSHECEHDRRGERDEQAAEQQRSGLLPPEGTEQEQRARTLENGSDVTTAGTNRSATPNAFTAWRAPARSSSLDTADVMKTPTSSARSNTVNAVIGASLVPPTCTMSGCGESWLRCW